MHATSSSQVSRSPLARLAAFLSDRSAFVLTLLLLEVGLVAGVWQAASQFRAAADRAPALERGAAPSTCSDAAVVFERSATERDITLLLTQFGATITYGPDENGAFLIQVQHDDAASSALAGLGDAPIVASMHRESVCR